MYRAGTGGGFQNFFLNVRKAAIRHGKTNLNAGDAPWISRHDFVDAGLHAAQVHAVIPGADAHDGHHAGR